MKPILFNTEMVRAIQDDRKTATRRVIKWNVSDVYKWACFHGKWHETYEGTNPPDDLVEQYIKSKTSPYKIGDILYVRETFFEVRGKYYYKADGKHLGLNALNGNKEFFKWRPSIHMPKKAARLFLRVTSVRTERLQDITPADVVYEGAYEDCRECLDTFDIYITTGKQCCYRDEDECSQCESVIESFAEVWNNCYASPQSVKENGKIVRYESYPWEDIRETRTYRGLPWLVIGNPWIWAIEFKSISKEEALK